jgi:hypothetical protein
LTSPYQRHDPFGRDWRLIDLDAERREGVLDSSYDGRRCGNCPAVARPFDADRIERRRALHVDDVYSRNVQDGGQEVFLQRRRLRLCFSVVKHILEECIADAMRNSASDLAIDDEGIDCPAAIVADGIAENVDTPEFRIDFHFRDMGSVGISRMRRKEIVDFCKAGLRRLAAEAGVPER